MKKLFKNRYFSFLMIYLCILCIFGTGLSLSKYTTNDTATDNSGVAKYDVIITSGDSTTTSTEISLSIYATSKLSEPDSMIDGTYEDVQINVINRSECTVSLSDFELICDDDDSVYEKIILDENSHDTLKETYESVPYVVLNYLGKTETDIGEMEFSELKSLISDTNSDTCDALEEDSTKVAAGESKTFYIISWVEHDSVYKEDADNNADDKISHKTPTQLGIEPEIFDISVYSEQVD